MLYIFSIENVASQVSLPLDEKAKNYLSELSDEKLCESSTDDNFNAQRRLCISWESFDDVKNNACLEWGAFINKQNYIEEVEKRSTLNNPCVLIKEERRRKLELARNKCISNPPIDIRRKKHCSKIEEIYLEGYLDSIKFYLLGAFFLIVFLLLLLVRKLGILRILTVLKSILTKIKCTLVSNSMNCVGVNSVTSKVYEFAIYSKCLVSDSEQHVHIAVKQGFCWPALFFTAIWAWAKGMIFVGFGLIFLIVIVSIITKIIIVFEPSIGGMSADVLITLALSVWIGKSASQWRETWLEKNDYEFQEIISGSNPSDAINNYLLMKKGANS